MAEMATDVLVLFMFGIGTSSEHLSRLGNALEAVAASVDDSAGLQREHGSGTAAAGASVAKDSVPSPNGLQLREAAPRCRLHGLPAPEVALLPRHAFFAETER